MNKHSVGKTGDIYTLTEYIEATNVYIVVTTYYVDETHSKMANIYPTLKYFTYKEIAEEAYNNISNLFFDNLKADLK